MTGDDTAGVMYYQGHIPPGGVYADMQNGKEPSCIFAAVAIITVMLFMLALLAL